MAKYKHAASPHFDPKVHLKKIGIANQTTMYKKETQATTDHRPQTIHHRPQATCHRPHTTDHRPQTTDHRPQTTDHRP